MNFMSFTFARRNIFLLFCLVVVCFTIPLPAMAQFDQRCFTETECTDFQQTQSAEFAQTTESSDVCSGYAQMNGGQKVGFCRSGQTTQTSVSFGNRNSFSGIADFISYIFRFSFFIATSLATIVIIISGLQWMSSAGNSSTISSAKSRIFGAMSGLVLLAFSYVILRTVNPALVDLRPLDVFFINPIETTPQFCSELDQNVSIFEAGEQGSTQVKTFADAVGTTALTADNGKCSYDYYIQNGGGQTCGGTTCANQNEACIPITLNGNTVDTSKSSCVQDDLTLQLNMTDFKQALAGAKSGFFTGLGKSVFDLISTDWVKEKKIQIAIVCEMKNDHNVLWSEVYAGTERAKLFNLSNNLGDIIQIDNDSSDLKKYLLKISDVSNIKTDTKNICKDWSKTMAGRTNNNPNPHGEGIPVGFFIRIKVDIANPAGTRGVYIGTNGVSFAPLFTILEKNEGANYFEDTNISSNLYFKFDDFQNKNYFYNVDIGSTNNVAFIERGRLDLNTGSVIAGMAGAYAGNLTPASALYDWKN